jgi:hypothetical protein
MQNSASRENVSRRGWTIAMWMKEVGSSQNGVTGTSALAVG